MKGPGAKGSISIPLALGLIVLLVLDLVLLESARISGIRFADQEAGQAAARSIEAAFIRQFFEEYGLLFYDGGQGTGTFEAEAIEAAAADC